MTPRLITHAAIAISLRWRRHASVLAATAAIFATASGPIAPRAQAADARDYLTRVDSVDLDRVVVQFREDAQVRLRGGVPVSLAGVDLSAVRAAAAAVEGAGWTRRWPRGEQELDQERARGEARTHSALPDLNSFVMLALPVSAGDGSARLAELLARLNSAPEVVAAFAVPRGALAGFREVQLAPTEPLLRLAPANGADRAPVLSSTPDFSPQQGYLYASPIGINADQVWTEAGGMGEGVKMIDLEFGWLFTHEDLKPAWYYGGAPAVADHGTAVLGEFGGQHNGYGINGIAPEMQIGAINTDDLAARIAEANGVLAPGDLYLIEIQISGPENWMPMEWIPDVFAAIQTSTALGIICIEAGANGTVNLDDALYGDTFNRRVRDSGAIMVGAGTPNGLDAEWFSDYGSRLDLQGWGSSIVTSCCGDLQGGAPEVQYTAGFNGTSGASPIVTGSVGSLQGQCLALYGRPLTPALAEEILSATGSPWVGAKQIGERPNLVAARERLLLGIGDLDVTVRDAVTHAPLPGLVVEVVETGR
ncbi:MAG: S8 family serine peptidase, partial [Candidatus Eisenbacteria bacterium]